MTLPPRQAYVAARIARGATIKQIAAELSLSQKTVEYHYANLQRRFGVAGQVLVAAQYRSLRSAEAEYDGLRLT